MSVETSARAVRAPRVSVVVPTYNRARDVARCLDSLVAQTFRDFEVLVCDDGSTDDTGAVVRSYQDRLDVSYHWAENFGGPARPRNRGIELARAPYVALLDSDDWWLPQKLEVSVRALDAGADVVYHDMYLVHSPNQRFHWRRSRTRPVRQPVYDHLLNYGNALSTSGVVVRRELLVAIGGFSEDRGLIAWEDYDAWLRLAKITERFERLPQPLGYYWAGGGNISTANRLIDNLIVFRERYGLGTREESPRRLPAWYHYFMGRAHFRLGAHEQVRAEMLAALAAGLPGSLKFKAAFFAAVASFRQIARVR